MDDAKPTTQKPPPKRSWLRRIAIGASLVLGLLVVTGVGLAIAQYVIQSRAATQGGDVKGPEVAIPTNPKSNEIEVPEETRRPIELALDRAKQCLQHSQRHINDYTAIATVRQRQKDGTLTDEMMFLKVRNRRLDKDGNLAVPFAIYMKFLKPKQKAGREVIWIEGANDGKLVGHEPGLLNLTRYHLPPDGLLAMAGQRYPIWEIGLERLVESIVREGEERKHERGDVEFFKGTVDGHSCTISQIIHHEKNAEYPLYMAQLFIDDERSIPLRYVAHLWPEAEGEDPPLDEEYTYQDVKLNVGLTDMDFDPDNPEYNYP
jgi:hypothetical protein